MVHSKILFQGSNIIKKDLEKLSSLNNEDWNLFIEEKNQTSHLGVQPGRVRGRLVD